MRVEIIDTWLVLERPIEVDIISKIKKKMSFAVVRVVEKVAGFVHEVEASNYEFDLQSKSNINVVHQHVKICISSLFEPVASGMSNANTPTTSTNPIDPLISTLDPNVLIIVGVEDEAH